jgi:hypothetical protein
MQHLERLHLARWDATQSRFIAAGALRLAALADADAAPERTDPPVTVEDRRTQRRRPPLPDADALADQLKAGMA